MPWRYLGHYKFIWVKLAFVRPEIWHFWETVFFWHFWETGLAYLACTSRRFGTLLLKVWQPCSRLWPAVAMVPRLWDGAANKKHSHADHYRQGTGSTPPERPTSRRRRRGTSVASACTWCRPAAGRAPLHST